MKKIFLALMIMLPVVGKSADAGVDAEESHDKFVIAGSSECCPSDTLDRKDARLQAAYELLTASLCKEHVAQNAATPSGSSHEGIPEGFEFIALVAGTHFEEMVDDVYGKAFLFPEGQKITSEEMEHILKASSGNKDDRDAICSNPFFLGICEAARVWREETSGLMVDIHLIRLGEEISAGIVAGHVS